MSGGFGDFALARYNPDGTLDESFGEGGKVVTDTNGKHSSADALVLQPDGKLVAAGTADNGADTRDDFALIRYNPDGTLDRRFGEGGRVSTDLGRTDDLAFDLALQRDGTLDKSFGGDGKVLTSIGKGYDAALALTIQRDGKPIAAGASERCDRNYEECYDRLALARYNSD